MKTLRMIVFDAAVLCLTIQYGRTQVTVQAGIDSMPPARSTISVKAKPSGALNGLFSGMIVTVQWLTSYHITLNLVRPNAYGIDTVGPVGTIGAFSYRTFGTATPTPINWAANSENELFTARAAGNPDTGSFYLTNAVPGNTRWYFELGGADLTNNTTPFYRGGVGGIRLPVQPSNFTATEFALKQNYPNPFNPSTEIKFSVETLGRATLEVYNIAGQKVATLFDGVAEPGQYYKVRFSGGNLASGVYLYRLQSGTRTDVKKLLLLK